MIDCKVGTCLEDRIQCDQTKKTTLLEGGFGVLTWLWYPFCFLPEAEKEQILRLFLWF